MLDIASLPADSEQMADRAGERARLAAERLGVETSQIERLPFDLSALESEGLFVNVDARGFGLLDRRLDWQALGIDLPRGTDVAFRPPRCGLLPDRYRLPLLRPAQRAHAALHRYSYRFTLTETLFETPAYRWVPWRAFPAFEAEFIAAREALDEAKGQALSHHDAIREEVVGLFLRLAGDSARRLEATGHAIPEGFCQAVVKGVLSAMPTEEDLRQRLDLRYRVGVVLLGSEMVAEQRRAADERRRLEEAEGVLSLERKRREAQERLVQEDLWAEQERQRERLRAEAEECRREAEVKERIRNLKLEAARERLQEALSPLEEGARQLHAAVYEAAVAIRESLQKHRYLPGGSAKRARELGRWFRLMNWQSDREMETLVGELEELARRPAGKQKRDPAQVEQVLGDIIALCYEDARALAEPNRMGALEL
ncbi:MAG: hypothetical protein M1401_04075 [Chloroflexi bacterium]|nr:hypothetical protein [Chloroflexota bacterium]